MPCSPLRAERRHVEHLALEVHLAREAQSPGREGLEVLRQVPGSTLIGISEP
jgi:hypothetical protein